MKRWLLIVLAAALLPSMTRSSQAYEPAEYLRQRRLHWHLSVQELDRQLLHRQAHYHGMSRAQHAALHDYLDRAALYDYLAHRRYHYRARTAYPVVPYGAYVDPYRANYGVPPYPYGAAYGYSAGPGVTIILGR